MGHNTEFQGELRFTQEISTTQLAFLSQFFGEDVRSHPEWQNEFTETFNWIDIELTPSFSGIQHDRSEKTYSLENQIRFIIEQMKSIMPDFGLKGEILAQGEDITDRYKIIVDGQKVEVVRFEIGPVIECPHCGEKIIMEE